MENPLKKLTRLSSVHKAKWVLVWLLFILLWMISDCCYQAWCVQLRERMGQITCMFVNNETAGVRERGRERKCDIHVWCEWKVPKVRLLIISQFKFQAFRLSSLSMRIRNSDRYAGSLNTAHSSSCCNLPHFGLSLYYHEFAIYLLIHRKMYGRKIYPRGTIDKDVAMVKKWHVFLCVLAQTQCEKYKSD